MITKPSAGDRLNKEDLISTASAAGLALASLIALPCSDLPGFTFADQGLDSPTRTTTLSPTSEYRHRNTATADHPPLKNHQHHHVRHQRQRTPGSETSPYFEATPPYDSNPNTSTGQARTPTATAVAQQHGLGARSSSYGSRSRHHE